MSFSTANIGSCNERGNIEMKNLSGILSDDHVFLLNTMNSSYAFGITEKKYLRHLHWGGRVGLKDLPAPDSVLRDELRFNREHRVEVQLQEYPSWGGEFYSEPALKVEFSNHVRCVILKFSSFAVEKEHLLVTLRAEEAPLAVDLHYRIHPEYDLIDRWSVVRNEGPDTVTLESALSASWHLPDGMKRLTHLSGRWGKEHLLNRTELPQGKIQLESRTGLSGPFNEPYFAFDDGTATEENGEICFGALQWSGNWKIAVEKDSEGHVSALGGIHNFDFSISLESGKEFVTPVFTGGFSRTGFGGASRLLHDYQREQLMPHEVMRKPMPLLFNSWGSMGIDVSEEKILTIAEKAAGIGVELFVIDDGWQTWLGDWVPDPIKFPNGLKSVVDRVRTLSMTFGLWVEVESFEVKSDLYKKHHEWALRFEETEPYFDYRADIDRTSVLLNLARPEVANFLHHTLRELLRTTGIGYLKLDMNSYLTNPGWAAVPPEKRRGVWVEYVRNLYSIFERLEREFPHVIFENCAAGAGRADLGMMRYFSRINRCDNQDPLDVLIMHEGFTYLHPTRSAGGACHIRDHVRAPLTIQYQAFLGMTGSLAVANNLLQCSSETLKKLAEYAVLYKKIRHIPQFGDMYRLKSITNSKATVFEFVAKDQREVVIFMFGGLIQFCDGALHFRLHGLNPDFEYTLTVYGQNMNAECPPLPERNSGRGLMTLGVSMPLLCDFDSRILHYKVGGENTQISHKNLRF